MNVLFNSLLFTMFLVLVACSSAIGQTKVAGQWLVQLPRNETPDLLTTRLEAHLEKVNKQPGAPAGKYNSPKSRPFIIEHVAVSMNIWLVKLENNDQDLLEWLKQQSDLVQTAQSNHYLSLRSNTLPDDPFFTQQWQYLNDGSSGGAYNADLDADSAWAYTTGGLTMAGDTIVVAVIDGGINKTHQDLTKNLWRNWSETPNDGIDNDENGFTDDFEGWNVFSQNDDIQGTGTIHGTPVSGIIGASGDNGVGVTGVNWNIKIMFVAGGNLESELLSAYDYVLQSRKRYNDSFGAKGAFVVAANCSWGIDYGMPSDAPLWCAAFDALGQAGIVGVAATANNAVDVDLVGDLPTTCPSDFLISVTSLDKFDQKASTAAWGATQIDLGGYGEGVFTTSSGNQYGFHSGTSFAAPHVAGAIGLLYASQCPELIAAAKNDPKEAALWVKNLILENSVPNTSLQGLTVTGGRLNLNNLLKQYTDQCASCPVPFGLKTLNVTPYSALLQWSTVTGLQNVTLRWREIGSGSWNILENVSGQYLLDGLLPCSNYEFSLQCTCSSGELSAWSPPLGFVSTGCCVAPDFSWIMTSIDSGIYFSWSPEEDFSQYKILIHKVGSPIWQTYATGDMHCLVSNLEGCTAYEIQFQGWCLDSWVNLTPATPFQTPGCGACLDKVYCPAMGVEAEEEWITSVQVGLWLNNSGWGGGGYQNLTETQFSNPQLAPLTAVDVVLTPGFWGSTYKEYFRIYIDYNLDGDFEDGGELAFDPGFAQNGIVVGSLVPPSFSQTGTTRMRVLMKYAEGNQAPPEACGDFDYGQVEDYCVDLVDVATDAKFSSDSSFILKIYPQPATNWVWIDVPEGSSGSYDLKIWDASGRQQLAEIASPVRSNLLYLQTAHWPSGIYFVSAVSEGKVFRGKFMKK